jgi:GNAT superfamily N-acetyltransferase
VKWLYAHTIDGREVGRAYVKYDPDEADDYAALDSIWVERGHRRQGIGTGLLTQVLVDAEVEGVEVHLYPEGFSGCPMSDTALRAWYGRHGFEMIGGGRMRYVPHGAG